LEIDKTVMLSVKSRDLLSPVLDHQESEVCEALDELSLKTSPLPNGRLLDAKQLELALSKSGIPFELVKYKTAAFVALSSPVRLERFAARMVAAADPKEREQLQYEINMASLRDRVARGVARKRWDLNLLLQSRIARILASKR
jgi:hypothetical protein